MCLSGYSRPVQSESSSNFGAKKAFSVHLSKHAIILSDLYTSWSNIIEKMPLTWQNIPHLWFYQWKGLRLHDNPFLRDSIIGADTLRCVYILDPWFAGSSNVGINRWRWVSMGSEHVSAENSGDQTSDPITLLTYLFVDNNNISIVTSTSNKVQSRVKVLSGLRFITVHQIIFKNYHGTLVN